MPQQRHGDKDLREVIKEAKRKSWRVTKDGGYWKMWCPNECKCFKTVKCTPGSAYYVNHLRQMLNRSTCWRKS